MIFLRHHHPVILALLAYLPIKIKPYRRQNVEQKHIIHCPGAQRSDAGIRRQPGLRPQVAHTAGQTIPYSGSLTGESSQPVADGAYDFSFALYAAESGGEPLWSETQLAVAVKGGAFASQLGEAAPLSRQPWQMARAGLSVAVRSSGESAFCRRWRLASRSPSIDQWLGRSICRPLLLRTLLLLPHPLR